MTIQDFRKIYEQKIGQQKQIQYDLDQAESQSEILANNIQDIEEAQTIIKVISQKTQQELSYRLSEIVSLAMSAIFDEPYKLQTDFIIRKNKTECKLSFERNGDLFDPLLSSGGGAIDIASTALRITLWKLMSPKTRNTLLLDEPMRFISKEYRSKATLMLQELSKKLNLQIIMVTHADEFIEGADKVFHIAVKNGISKIVS